MKIVERRHSIQSRLKDLLRESIVLMEASEKETVADSLRYVSEMAPELLNTSVVGKTLIVSISNYPLVQVDLEREAATIWVDWRDRILTSVEEHVRKLSKGLISALMEFDLTEEEQCRIKETIEDFERGIVKVDALRDLLEIFGG